MALSNTAVPKYYGLFREAVLAWLTNGEPKYFRSPTEGNHIIRIMNVREHLQKREERARQILNSRSNNISVDVSVHSHEEGPVINPMTQKKPKISNQVPNAQSKQNGEAFDLQKELEKKFDELFGTSN